MSTFVPFDRAEIERSIPARFEGQVHQYPGRLAIKTRQQAVTYAALNQAANRVGWAIQKRLGRDAEPVALLLENDVPLIGAILGTLKAGKLYVPLDPAHQGAGHAAILEDTQARLIVTDTKHLPAATALAPPGVQILDVDTLGADGATDDLGLALSGDTLAYILYTSGSTGQAKGVVQSHRNVLHKIMLQTNTYRIGPDDRLSLLHSCSSNASVRHLFGALLNGATLYPWDLRAEGIAPLAAWMMGEELTITHWVPSVFRSFTDTLTGDARFPALRLIYVAGDAVTRKDVARYRTFFAEHCLFAHGLASNEVGTIREYCLDSATPITDPVLPVGYAVEDKQVLLLDEHGEEVGVNRAGEIVVKSCYLSPGYWRRPELTRKAFLPDPAGGNARLYRTGDLGRMRPDGCLEYLGREDFRVKVRGYQVDPAAVESVLLEHPALKDVVVVAQGEQSDETRLVAYVVPATDPAPPASVWREFVQATLPAYMVPAVFVALDALPMLPTGKVDRRALPVPDRSRLSLERPFIAPRTPVEEVVARLWQEVLGLDPIGVHDNFLELGGHSLLALRVVARVQGTWPIELSMRDLLAAPTVADMAIVITQHLAETVAPEAMELLLKEVEGLSENETV